MFTEKELFLLSDGLLALIKKSSDAKALVNGDTARAAIEDEIKEMVSLNSKICGMIKE